VTRSGSSVDHLAAAVTGIQKDALTTGFPLRRTAKRSAKIGSYYLLQGVTVNTTDTTLTHGLGRIPTGYHTVRSPNGDAVYDGSHLGSDWTRTQIVLRAPSAGTYSVLIF
jgi:hypothetical protein